MKTNILVAIIAALVTSAIGMAFTIKPSKPEPKLDNYYYKTVDLYHYGRDLRIVSTPEIPGVTFPLYEEGDEVYVNTKFNTICTTHLYSHEHCYKHEIIQELQ